MKIKVINTKVSTNYKKRIQNISSMPNNNTAIKIILVIFAWYHISSVIYQLVFENSRILTEYISFIRAI